MARRKHQPETDRQRMTSAMRRLENLILDPGPGIIAADASDAALTLLGGGTVGDQQGFDGQKEFIRLAVIRLAPLTLT